MSDVENVISQLEQQRSAIDRALSALREVTGSSTTSPNGQAITATKGNKRRLSPEGRRRIIEATKKRWAAKRAAQAGSVKPAAATSHRGKLSAEGRKRLALSMKKRWAAAKKAGKQRLS